MRHALLLQAVLLLSSCANSPERQVAYRAPMPGKQLEDGLVVGTYNLHGIEDAENLSRTLKELDFVDVWAFQEVNGPWNGHGETFAESHAPDDLAGILPDGPWFIYYVPLNPIQDSPQVEGLAIASRLRFSDKAIWRLPASRDREPGGKRRAALAASVDQGDRKILIVNTDHEVGWVKIRPSDRQLQVEALLERLDSAAENLPVVVMGDFNCSGRPLTPWIMTAQDELGKLRSSLKSVGMHRLPGPEEPLDSFRAFAWSHPIDHIFTRGLGCRRWGTTKGYVGSDHRPLWAEVAGSW